MNCPDWSFTTLPDPTFHITPNQMFTEGFEQSEVGDIPLGWELENLNDDNAFWSTIANSITSVNAHTGQKALHMSFSFLSANNDWIYTPPLQLTGGSTYKLEFWYKAIPFPGDPCVEKMEVKWGVLPNALAMSSQLLLMDSITNETYQRSEVTITPPLDGSYFIGFHAFSDPLQFILLIDDIKVSLTTSAADQMITNPGLTGICVIYPNPFAQQAEIFYYLDKNSLS